MLYIKTDLPYDQLDAAEIIPGLMGIDSEAVHINYDDKYNFFKVEYGDQSMPIHRGLYEKAQDMGGELIKVDFTQSKARRIREDEVGKMKKVEVSGSFGHDIESIDIQTVKLNDINFDDRLFNPIRTGQYIDNFISYKGGFMPGINIMVTGDPGVGKSSNLMDMLVNIKQTNPSSRVLYISAEMNRIDVKEFQQYYPGLGDIDFLYISDYVTNPDLNIQPYQALMSVLNQGWDIVVMDSFVEIQSMIQEDLAMSAKKSEKWILDLLNRHNSGHNKLGCYTAFLCIQQKNKGGSYVGSKRLEHMTSAFLSLCWDKKESGKRYMIFEKNRKGKEKVKLYYTFDKDSGIVYDESRHTKELQILEKLQSSGVVQLDELDSDMFEKLFTNTDDKL